MNRRVLERVVGDDEDGVADIGGGRCGAYVSSEEGHK